MPLLMSTNVSLIEKKKKEVQGGSGKTVNKWGRI